VAPVPAAIEVRSALTRDPATGEIVAALTLTNTGTATANTVVLSSATLNSVSAAALPDPVSIAGGASVTTQVRFPGSVGAAGTPAVLRVAGAFGLGAGDFTSSL